MSNDQILLKCYSVILFQQFEMEVWLRGGRSSVRILTGFKIFWDLKYSNPVIPTYVHYFVVNARIRVKYLLNVILFKFQSARKILI
jgi:hypothetical protein